MLDFKTILKTLFLPIDFQSQLLDAGVINLLKPSRANDIEATVKQVQETYQVSEDDARKIVAATIYEQTKQDGIDPASLYENLPPELKQSIRLRPQDLDRAQQMTVVVEGSKIVIGLGALAYGIYAKNPKIVAASAAGLYWALSGLAGNLNDVFVHGENYVQSAALEAYKLQQKGADLGVTSFGDFDMDEIRTLVSGYERAGGKGFKDPKTGTVYPVTVEGIQNVLSTIISDFNASGIGPTKDVVVAALRSWAIGPQSALDTLTSFAASSGGSKTYKREPVTRQYASTVAKPKLFVGTIFSGAVAPESTYVRHIDDQITDEQDLINDAKINLTRWLATLPGLLTVEIQVKNSPFDEQGVKKLGTWCTLAIYINNNKNTRLFIDEILLGPINPAVYYPEYTRTQAIQIEIPKELRPETLKPLALPGGGLITVDQNGIPVNIFPRQGTGTTDAASAAPAGSQPSSPTGAKPASSQPPPIVPVEDAIAVANRDKQPVQIPGTDKYVLPEGYNVTTGGVRSTFGQEPPKLISVPPSEAPKYVTAEAARANPPAAPIYPKRVTVNVSQLNVRAQPTSQSPNAGSGRLNQGDVFEVTGWVYGENVQGESRWWKSSRGNFVWVGGTAEKP